MNFAAGRALRTKTLAVIPARLGATRLPRKPLRSLAGKPLVVRVWERVTAMRLVDRCVVATDAEDVATAVRAEGAECVLTADTHPSGTDRVAEVAARIEFREYATIVNVQGDEPFVSAAAIDGAVQLVDAGRFPVGTTAVHADASVLERPDVVKVVAADDGRAMYFSRAPIPFLRDDADRDVLGQRVLQHVGVYAYTREALDTWVGLPPHPLERIERLEQLRPLAAGIPMGVTVMTERPWGGVDTEDDLARANRDWRDFTRGRT